MAYEKVNWKDYPDTTTPVTAQNLNHMDNQIATNEGGISGLSERIGNEDISAYGGNVTSAVQSIGRSAKDSADKVKCISQKMGSTPIDSIGDGSVTGAIAAVDAKAKKNASDITTIKSAISGLDGDFTDVVVEVAKNKNDIAGIKTDIGTENISGIGSSIKNAIANLARRITAAEKGISDLGFDIGKADISSLGSTVKSAIVELKRRIDGKLDAKGMVGTSNKPIYMDLDGIHPINHTVGMSTVVKDPDWDEKTITFSFSGSNRALIMFFPYGAYMVYADRFKNVGAVYKVGGEGLDEAGFSYEIQGQYLHFYRTTNYNAYVSYITSDEATIR